MRACAGERLSHEPKATTGRSSRDKKPASRSHGVSNTFLMRAHTCPHYTHAVMHPMGHCATPLPGTEHPQLGRARN